MTAIGNFTQPNLRTWAGETCAFELSGITETNGVITFDVNEAVQPDVLVEDFEQMEATSSKTLKQVQGNFAKWSFNGSNVTAPGEQYCDGQHAVRMVKPSLIAMDEPLMVRAFRIEYTAFNSSTTDAKLTLYSSTDGKTWTKMHNEYVTVPAGGSATYFQQIDMRRPLYFRLTMAGGSATQPCYVDNIKFYYNGQLVLGDVTGNGEVDVADVNAIIKIMMGKAASDEAADVDGDGLVDIKDINMVINLMLGK